MLCVVAFHFGLPVPGGFCGVDVFFVISGFLITGHLVRDLHRGRYAILDFYARRARRILPALVVMLATCCSVGSVLLLPSELKALGLGAAAAAFSVSNVLFWRQSGYFDSISATNPLLHTWSLAIEEQFYILLPVGLFLLARVGRRGTMIGLGVALSASCILSTLWLGRHASASFYLLPSRAWELLVGSVLALLPKGRLPRQASEALGLTGLLLVGASFVMLKSSTPFPGAAALPVCIGAAVLIGSGQAAPTAATRVLSLPPIVFIGRISYSLYLWHWPVLVFAKYFKDVPLTAVENAALLLASLVVAAASWRFVEEPIRRARTFARPHHALIAGCSSAVLIAAPALGLAAMNGLPGRVPPEAVRFARSAEDKDLAGLRCANLTPAQIDRDASVCKIGGTGPPSWALWGDSYGWALQRPVSQWLAENGRSGWSLLQIGCPPLVGYSRPGYEIDCAAANDAAMRFLRRHGIRDVVLVSSWSVWLHHPEFFAGRTGAADSDAFELSFRRTVHDLRQAGLRVWVTDPLPIAKASVPQWMAKSAYLPGRMDIRPSTADYQAESASALRLFDQVGDGISGRFRPELVLCRNGHCAIAHDGRPLAFDSNHPAASQAAYFAEVLRLTAPAGIDRADRGVRPQAERTMSPEAADEARHVR